MGAIGFDQARIDGIDSDAARAQFLREHAGNRVNRALGAGVNRVLGRKDARDVGINDAAAPLIASYRLLDPSRREADVAFLIVPFTEQDIFQRRLMRISYGLYGSEESALAMQRDPASVGLILMNSAQAHFPDVAWLLDRFPRSWRAFTSTSRAVQARICAQGMGVVGITADRIAVLLDNGPLAENQHSSEKHPTESVVACPSCFLRLR